MIRGSCCCGAVRFQLTEPPEMMGTCHCSRCRKVGASTFVFVKPDTFRWIEGEEHVARYEPAAPFKFARGFCRVCGTALGEIGGSEGSFLLAAHCLDDDPVVRNRFHEWVSFKPAWYEIHDDAKQFAEYPNPKAL